MTLMITVTVTVTVAVATSGPRCRSMTPVTEHWPFAGMCSARGGLSRLTLKITVRVCSRQKQSRPGLGQLFVPRCPRKNE